MGKTLLRKYLKKKREAKTLEQFDRVSILYYRYHRKVYGLYRVSIWE